MYAQQAPQFSMGPLGLVAIMVAVMLVFSSLVLLVIVRQYKRCPPNRLLVIWGKSPRMGPYILNEGAMFVYPLLQDYAYLDLAPLPVELSVVPSNAKKLGFEVPREYTVAIGVDEELSHAAALRLLGLSREEIRQCAEDVLSKSLAQTVDATVSAGIDQAAFHAKLEATIRTDLKSLGLELISVRRL